MAKADPADVKLLTVAQARARLACGKTRIYKLGKLGKLTLVKFGRNTRVTEQSVQNLEREIAASPKKWSPTNIGPDSA